MKELILSESLDANAREDFRSNVLLSAVLTVGCESVPVRIRNLSHNGALVDGPGLPHSGRTVLRRGHLSANAEVAWVGDGECGIRFDDPVDLKRWVKRVVHPGQQRVDTIVTALRVGVLPHSVIEAGPGADLRELSQQLAAVTTSWAMLPNMTDELAEQTLKVEVLTKGVERHAAAIRENSIAQSLR